MESLYIVFELIKDVVCGKALSEEAILAIKDGSCLGEIYKLSKKYDLLHLVADALEKNNLLPQETEKREKILKSRRSAVCRYEQLHYEFERIASLLEQEKIPYMPLKGAVLRAYYPQPWMRTSCDIDILVHAEDLEKARDSIIEALGYEQTTQTLHDVSLCISKRIHLELHHCLIDESEANSKELEVVGQTWEDAVPTQLGGYRYEMTWEMFYFYHVLHAAKHFRIGGCGIRPLLDLWILNHQILMDKERREKLLKEAGLLTFAKAMERLSEVWFSGAQADEVSKEMQSFILRAGLYGGVENNVAIQQKKKGGKGKYLRGRIFMPYKSLKKKYPILEKHKWLVPFYQIRRWFETVFKRGKLKNSINEAKLVMGNNENNQRVEALFEKLELWD